MTPSDPAFASYGGRGVTVDQSWLTFVGFLDWALDNGYRADLQLDRINSDGNYEPANCRWVSGRINITRRALERDGQYLGTLRGNLSDDLIAAAAVGRHYDGHGLYLNVRSSGLLVWRFRFRHAGRDGTLTFGHYPKISIIDARELATIAKAKLALGLNPATIRANSKARSARRVRAKQG